MNLKTVFLLTLISLMSCSSTQKIKVKQGEILYNQTKHIGFSNYNNGGYVIKDLNNHSFRVERVMGDSGESNDYFYVLNFNFTNQKMELPSSEIGFRTEKGTIEYLVENNYWNLDSGLNVSAIKKLVEQTGTAVTDAKKVEKANEVRAKAIDAFVKRDGTIVKGGSQGTKVIGYVKSPDHYLATSLTPIKIYDAEHNLIAKGKSTIINNEVFTTFDGKKHKYRAKYELNELTKLPFLTEMVYCLILEGYIYGGKINYDKKITIFEE
ncbi:hypothetical protein [Polaribacter cellanae]|uniref:Lipoprotein n=1 Tax=Polaribacter cellanae TaxID=2818493 RepID=A0A975CQC9_9FLAO|nr:hypothetical protein [Polaribacter cellanae]QTE23569.1 hypothetical protein J3359_04605 [Polaribacter cellanae]